MNFTRARKAAGASIIILAIIVCGCSALVGIGLFFLWIGEHFPIITLFLVSVIIFLALFAVIYKEGDLD